MIKAIADTNFLVDIVAPERNGAIGTSELWDSVLAGKISIGICAGSLNDMYYSTRKQLSDQERRQWVLTFMAHTYVFPVDENLCAAAAMSNEPDFEDAMIRICAERWDANFILSRDRSRHAFERSWVPRIEAPELVGLVS